VSGLFSRQRFTGFGLSSFNPSARVPSLCRVHAFGAARLRKLVRQQCPRRPGVYGMVDPRGELIYVGKAKCLRTRLATYFRPNSRDAKAGRILEHTAAIVWEYLPSEFAALLRELELIHRWRPRFNVHGQPGRYRRTYVCLGRQPAPHAFVACRPPAGAVAAFGPVPGGRRAGEAVRRLNDWFGLRDCPRSQAMVFADQGELFPVLRAAGCIRHEIGTCLGPCAAACTRAAYRESVKAARAFLDGTEAACLEQLERDMRAAADGQQFERAAALRDKLEPLRWLHEHLGRLRSAREQYSFIYPVRGHGGVAWWYLIRRGEVAGVVAAPRSSPGQEAIASRIAAVYGENRRWARPAASEAIDGILLVAAWFRRHAAELERTLDPAPFLSGCRT
jgi:excinuclease ABC subunit C